MSFIDGLKAHGFEICSYVCGQLTYLFETNSAVSGKVKHVFEIISNIDDVHCLTFKIHSDLSSVFSHKFIVVRFIESLPTHTFAISEALSGRKGHNFSLAFTSGCLLHSFSLLNWIQNELGSRFRIADFSFSGYFGAKVRYVGANITIYRNGQSRTIPAVDLKVTRSRSEAIKWAVGIFDPNGTYSPENTESGWEDWLRAEEQPHDPQKHVSIEIFTESGSRKYTDLIILSREYNADPEDGYNLKIAGADFSQILFYKNQTLQTLKFSSYPTAALMVKSLLMNYGFTSWSLPKELNYPVMQLDVQQDMPINRIQTLLNEIGAYWKCEGRTFQAWIPPDGKNAAWNYTDSKNLYFLSLHEQIIDYYNKVTVCRVNKNATLAYAGEGTDDGWPKGGTFQYGTVVNPSFRILAKIGCDITDINYFYNDNYVGSGGHILGKADEIRFRVTPNNPNVATYWKVEVRGIPLEISQAGIDPDRSIYTIIRPGTAGDKPAPDIQSPFTTQHTAALKAKAFIKEQGRIRKIVTFGAPINPYLEVDDVIFIEESISRYNGYFCPESITTNVRSPDGEDIIEVVQYEE